MRNNNYKLGMVGFLILITIALTNIAAWATHVIYCIDTERWGFLVAGAIAFPVGIIHGIGIWFGTW
jgi:hypothetical protein